MARDRKKAKQRQRRQQRTGPPAAAAPGSDAALEASEPDLGAPDPLEHASGDAEIAKLAQRGAVPAEEPGDDEAGEVFEDELEPVAAGGGDGAGGGRGGVRPSGGEGGGGARSSPGDSSARPRAGGSRFVNFLRASVAELRRVQWPDRRQVTQATGVVLGFVVIAGAYLGLLDAIWSRVVSVIL